MTKRGRPEKRFLSDPDRFAVAFADMLVTAGISQTKAFLLTAGMRFGRQVEPSAKTLARRSDKVEAGWSVISFETGQMTPVAGKASTLRKKAERATSDRDINWRATVASAFWLAFFRQDKPFGQLRDEIQITCASVGEPALAEALLHVMTTGQKLPTGIYSTIFAARDVIDGVGVNAIDCIEAPRDPDRSRN